MTDDRHDRVRRRAYELWEQQGSEHGRHEDHWHRASAEIDGDDRPDAAQVALAAPDGTTLTVPDDTVEGEAPAAAKPARKRAAPKPAAPPATDKAPPKPRKPKAK